MKSESCNLSDAQDEASVDSVKFKTNEIVTVGVNTSIKEQDIVLVDKNEAKQGKFKMPANAGKAKVVVLRDDEDFDIDPEEESSEGEYSEGEDFESSYFSDELEGEGEGDENKNTFTESIPMSSI